MSQPRDPIYAVSILAHPCRSIYAGATEDLERRVFKHKTKHPADSHSVKYGIERLVWWNRCEDWAEARTIELKLKNMHRDGKVVLVNKAEPKWQDLSYVLFAWSSGRFKRLAN
jgi:putative endonuclease